MINTLCEIYNNEIKLIKYFNFSRLWLTFRRPVSAYEFLESPGECDEEGWQVEKVQSDGVVGMISNESWNNCK